MTLYGGFCWCNAYALSQMNHPNIGMKKKQHTPSLRERGSTSTKNGVDPHTLTQHQLHSSKNAETKNDGTKGRAILVASA